MLNMTGRNVPDYLIKTRLDNIEKLFGGFEFGVRYSNSYTSSSIIDVLK